MWYQPMNFNFRDAQEFYAAISETVTAKAALAKATPEQREAIKTDMMEDYDKRMGLDVLDPRSFEVMIITAIKP